MALPVALYLAISAGGPGAGGWGAAMSTDTALALGALSLVGPPAARLRVFLLTLAVVDDLGALLVIAFAYTEHVSLVALAAALALFALFPFLRFAGTWRGPAAALLGIGVWLAMFDSGVDPVVSSLAIGLVTGAYWPVRGDLERATELPDPSASSPPLSLPTPPGAASPRRSPPTSGCSTVCTRGRAS